LHCAIRSERVEIVEDLLRKGADPNAISSDGLTPLHRSIKMDCPISQKRDCDLHLAIAIALVEYKANINLKDSEGLTPLMFAAKVHNARAFKYLIEHGADPHALYGNSKSSLWHLLASGSGEESDKALIQSIAQQLIAAKVDLNKPDNEGNTPLQQAIINNNSQVVNLLLDNKVKTGIKNNEGHNLLVTAIANKKSEILELLLSRGFRVNISDEDGSTPLMKAIAAPDPYGDFLHQKLLLVLWFQKL
jgi:ankyrin repeat protein